MVGLILALIYLGLQVLYGKVLALACIAALTFLWWWFAVWFGVTLLLCLTMFVVGLFKPMKVDNTVVLLVGGPALAIISSVRYIVLLIGIQLILLSSQCGDPTLFEEWDKPKWIIGLILLVIGFCFSFGSSNVKFNR